MRFLILSLVFSLQALASKNCEKVPVVVSGKVRLITLEDGATKSLFDEGNSLENFKVQDQDGLNTCYANTNSAILQSILPGNPDLSYTHAAMAHGVLGWESLWFDDKDKKLSTSWGNGSTVMDYGRGCSTLAALKKAGGACRKLEGTLEAQIPISNKNNNDSFNYQELTYKSLADFFDFMIDSKPSQEKMKELKDEFVKLEKFYNEKKQEDIDKCKNDPSKLKKEYADQMLHDQFNINLAYATYVSEHDSPQVTQCKQTLLSAYSPHLKQVEVGDDGYTFKIKDELNTLFQKAIFNDPEVQAQIKKFEQEYLDSKAIQNGNDGKFTAGGMSDSSFSDMRKAVHKRVVKFMDELIENPNKEALDKNCKIPFGFVEGEETDFIGYGWSESDYWKNMMSLMDPNLACPALGVSRKRDQLVKEYIIDNNCPDDYFVAKSLNIIKVLSDVSGEISKKTLDDLFNKIPSSFDDYIKVIAPGCEQPENRVSVDHLSCTNFITCDGSQRMKNKESATYTGPKNGCYDMGSLRYIARMKVLTNLKKNRALGIDVCTGFMNNYEYVDTKYCQKEANNNYMHAMTVSGYKCVNGNIHYELLNSYGIKSCPNAARTEIKDRNNDVVIQCIRDENGKLTGRFYVEEDYLLKNTTGLVQIGDGK